MHGHWQWAEFVPVAPLLPLLAEVAGYFVAFGLCVVAVYLVKALFQAADSAFGWIPWLGSKITGDLHRIEQRITHYLGGAAASFDKRMALAWHKLAHTASWIAHEIEANAGTMLAIATVLAQPWSIPAWKQLYGSLVKHGQTVTRLFKAEVYAITRPIVGELTALEKYIGGKVRTYDKAIERTIPKDIAGLRARTKTIEGELTRLWELLRKNEAALATTAFVGAVAIALSRLGGSWIRCNNWQRIGRSVCGLPVALLDDLLGAAIVSFAVTDICDFANVAQSLAQAFEPDLIALVDVENALVGCHGATLPPDFTMRALSLPPKNLGLPLAA